GGANNFSQPILANVMRDKSLIPPTPKPAKGGKSAAPAGKNGAKVSGGDIKLEKKPYIPHAIVFFIGGAADQEPFIPMNKTLSEFITNGANHNIDDARHAFNIEKAKIDSILLETRVRTATYGYSDIYTSTQITHLIDTRIKLYDETDKKHGKRTLIYIVGHSLGGWNGAHLTELLSSHGYTTEMLITLDPVGTNYATTLIGAKIYNSEPNVKANHWINIFTDQKLWKNKIKIPNRVTDIGGQWIPNPKPSISAVADINHANAGSMFLIKLANHKSPCQLLLESLEKELK
ncbi:MAG: hypothetical protein ACYDD5_05905, partial [Sulfuricurvum sp.]